MTVSDFINKNGLSSCLTSQNGSTMEFTPSDFSLLGYKIDKIKILCNRDSCIMHVYLYGNGLMQLGKALNDYQFKMCELGFKCLVQSYSVNEITIYSIDPDSHVYDLEYQTGRSWNDLLGW